jgi:hypothetical protein
MWRDGITIDQGDAKNLEGWNVQSLEACKWPDQAVLRCWSTLRSEAAGFGCSCSWNVRHDGKMSLCMRRNARCEMHTLLFRSPNTDWYRRGHKFYQRILQFRTSNTSQ